VRQEGRVSQKGARSERGCLTAGCPTAAVRGGSPRTRFPLLFRTGNPTRNAAVPASPQIPVIVKT